MKHSNKNIRSLTRHLGLLGLFTALAVPSVSAATPTTTEETTPIAAADDPCEQAVVALQLDVDSGLVYLVEGTALTLIDDNELNIYFGRLTSVVVDLEFTTGEWEVEISPTGSATEIHYTRGGALRYTITDDPDEYLFSFTELSSGASTMMNMAPILPDIILQPDKDCPPPT